MSDTVWSYRDSDWSQDRDLVGYEDTRAAQQQARHGDYYTPYSGR